MTESRNKDNRSSMTGKLKERFSYLAKFHRTELIVAVVVTLLVFTVVPIYAWFTYQRSLAELQYIKSPDLLYITAANAEATKQFKMSGINVNKKMIVDGVEVPVTHQLFPFCVAGDYVSSFTLQLAHTSNNPYVYKIFEGEVMTSESEAIATGREYVEYTVTYDLTDINVAGLNRDSITPGDILYIVKGDRLDTKYGGRYLNMSNDGRTATNRYLEECYGNEDGNYMTFTDYELPLYWQCSGIPSVDDVLDHGSSFFKTFIIEVNWEGKTVSSDKETDIVYLMAFTGSH